MSWWHWIMRSDQQGTDAETRAAVAPRFPEEMSYALKPGGELEKMVARKAADAAADGYRKGYEEAERQLLFTLKYLPPEMDVREFVDRLIEKRLAPLMDEQDAP